MNNSLIIDGGGIQMARGGPLNGGREWLVLALPETFSEFPEIISFFPQCLT